MLPGLVRASPACVYHAEVGKCLAFTATVRGLAEEHQGLFETPPGFVKGVPIHVDEAQAIQGLGLAVAVDDLTADRQRLLVVVSGLIKPTGFKVGLAETDLGAGLVFGRAATDLSTNVQRLLIDAPGLIVFAHPEMDGAKSYSRLQDHIQVTVVAGLLVGGACAFQVTLLSQGLPAGKEGGLRGVLLAGGHGRGFGLLGGAGALRDFGRLTRSFPDFYVGAVYHGAIEADIVRFGDD